VLTPDDVRRTDPYRHRRRSMRFAITFNGRTRPETN
jgi:hypothetical protein